mmetsp:Transcript_15737/g.33238  ORF Transcript_15737/g.33238 Transcript_15737/m.33238 type:complete len:242 (-) Transcript_15737:92-817(-)
MQITGHERSLQSSRASVQNDAPGDQKACQLVVHARQSLDGRRATQQKHGSDNDVGEEGEDQEGEVRGLAPARSYDFAHGVGGGRNVLQGDGEDSEEEDLDSGSRGIPEGTTDTILPGDVRTLKQGRGPCPLRDDDGGGQAGLDHTPSGVEMFTSNRSVARENLVHVNHQGSENAEQCAEAQDNEVTDGSREGRRSAKVRTHAKVFGVLRPRGRAELDIGDGHVVDGAKIGCHDGVDGDEQE